MYIDLSRSQIKTLLKKFIDESDADSLEFKLTQQQVHLILKTYVEELPATADFAKYIVSLVTRYSEWQGSDTKALLKELDKKFNIHR